MDRRNDETRLAALLDGELHETDQLAALNNLLEHDPLLRAELEAQTEVKSLLGQLEEYQAPDFMATRVLGEIAARRNAQRSRGWRPLTAWLSGAAALLVGFASTFGLLVPRAAHQTAPLLAERSTAATPVSDSGRRLVQPGLFMEVEYAPAIWDELPMPAGNDDERIEDFLRFASESHTYRRMLRSSGCDTAGMANAVLVMNGGGQQPPVHFAAQD